jgi:hypothetical protein
MPEGFSGDGAGMNAMLPQVWRPDLPRLLPPDADVFHGPALAIWLTGFMLSMVTARSLVHLFAPDGGAGSIATIDTRVAGGRNIIAIFGQWGAMQLIVAGLLWVLLLRYRGLTPLILCALLSEPFLRALAGRLKPIETVGVAPGSRYNWLPVPVVVVTLYLALCPAGPR